MIGGVAFAEECEGKRRVPRTKTDAQVGEDNTDHAHGGTRLDHRMTANADQNSHPHQKLPEHTAGTVTTATICGAGKGQPGPMAIDDRIQVEAHKALSTMGAMSTMAPWQRPPARTLVARAFVLDAVACCSRPGRIVSLSSITQQTFQ